MHLQEQYLARELSPDNVESLLFGQEVESAVRNAPEKKSQKGGDEVPSTESRKNVIEIGVPNTHGSAYMGFGYMVFWWFFGYIIIWKRFP